jgi:putative hydrolase of the HAD superfamily
MIKAVLFDIDGTLVDHHSAQQAALARLCETLEEAQRVPFDEFAAAWHREAERYMEQYLAGEITFVQQRHLRIRAVFDCLGEDVSDDRAMRVFQTYLAEYEGSWNLYDDVLPCLESMDGYALAVLSNGDSGQQRRKLEKMGIAPYFSSVVISGDLDVSKPHPGIFERSLQELGVSAREAVYVGDHLESDALGAEGVGMRAIWLARERYEDALDALPVPAIESLLQVKGIVAAME